MVETVMVKLPVCTPFALPVELKVAISLAPEAKHGSELPTLKFETVTLFPLP